jgi:hypothetical protein
VVKIFPCGQNIPPRRKAVPDRGLAKVGGAIFRRHAACFAAGEAGFSLSVRGRGAVGVE